MNKRKKLMKKMMAMLVVFGMMWMLAIPIWAADSSSGGALVATDDPKDSIMLIALGIEDDNKNFYDYQWGTCFLINDECVLTNKHVVTVSNDSWEDFAAFAAGLGIPDIQPTDSHIQLKLYVNRDMKIGASIIESVQSDEMDFAAVKLSEKVYNRKPVAIGDSDQIQQKDTVYAYGFPADSIENKNYNTSEDVSIVEGSISKLTVTGTINIIEHTAELSNGNSGGPLLNEENEVIGLNTFVVGNKNYSVQINHIKDALDTFGIAYVSGSGTGSTVSETEAAAEEEDTDAETSEGASESASETEPESEPEPVVDNTALFDQLRNKIETAKEAVADPAQYTDESVEALNTAIEKGETVLNNAGAGEAEIEQASTDIDTAVNGLEKKSGLAALSKNTIIIIIIIAAVVVVVIVLLVMMNQKKKKAEPQIPPRPVAPQTPPASQPAQPYYQNQAAEGAGETTLLDAGAGETTLLGGVNSGAYLIRKSNGEKIAIGQQNFRIGKERRKVNYCISDNTSVSRLHCEIVKKGADYYAVDQGSTNFTYVNGIQLSPQKETLLTDKSVLKLSDEEFEFHLS